MRMLSEMAAAYPAIGGFYEYNRLALGELAGFLTGWMYWYFWVIVVALEAVAGARLLNFWFPEATPWVLTLGLVLTFTVLNLLSVRSWGEVEYWFAFDQGRGHRRVSVRRSRLHPRTVAAVRRGFCKSDESRRIHAARHRARADRGRSPQRGFTSALSSSRLPPLSPPEPRRRSHVPRNQ